MRENLFTPNSGEAPLVMAGRGQCLRTFSDAVRRKNRAPELTTLISGTQGSGKTSLLLRMSEEAESNGWVVARTTCLDGMLEDIYVQALKASKNVLDSTAPRKVASIGVGSFSVGWESQRDAPSTWRTRMAAILDALAEYNTGLVITVDEVGPDEQEMIQLAAIYQHFVGEGRKVSLLMAGLPFNVSSLLQGKGVSFLSRACRQRIGRVTDLEVELALSKTIQAGGRDIERDALDQAVKAIEGLPFMLQLVGYRSWEVNPKTDVITAADVQEGTRIAYRELRDQVLESTYRELSDGDVAFLVAMLPDHGDSRIADIAQRLGKSSGYVNSYRRRMLELGVIGERRRGVVGFDLPGFADYLLERSSEDGFL